MSGHGHKNEIDDRIVSHPLGGNCHVSQNVYLYGQYSCMLSDDILGLLAIMSVCSTTSAFY